MKSLIFSDPSKTFNKVVIRQDLSNGFFCLTDLQSVYEDLRLKNNWVEKKISNILSYRENAERIYFLLKEQGLSMPKINFFQMCNKRGLTTALKDLNFYKCYGRGDNRLVFCNPYIWLLVCQELHSRLYAESLNYIISGDFKFFTLSPFDTAEYEETQRARLNREAAWKYFYPEGNGKAKPGYHLHHIDPTWRYEDTKRYNDWNIQDLIMLTASEHIKLHHELGFDYICDSDTLSDEALGGK